MRALGRFVFIAFFCLAAVHAFADTDGDAGRLVGTWHEYKPDDNMVKFTADGHVVMYLKKGEIGDLHTIEGTWSLAKDGTLTVTFSANGRSFSQAAKLSYSGDEMILTDDKGEQTHHNRHTGPLPAWTQW
jgi:uncharacterized protein (TIGR03066 family)